MITRYHHLWVTSDFAEHGWAAVLQVEDVGQHVTTTKTTMGTVVAVATGITNWMCLPLVWCRLSAVLGSVPLVHSIKLLELEDSEGCNK